MISVKKLLYKVVTKIASHNSTLSSHTSTLSSHTSSITELKKARFKGDPTGAQIANKNVSSGGSWTNLGSVAVPAGAWIAFISVSFANDQAGGVGYRQVTLSTTNSSSTQGIRTVRARANVGADTDVLISCPVAGSTTYYVNCVQNSGKTLSVATRYTFIKVGDSFASV